MNWIEEALGVLGSVITKIFMVIMGILIFGALIGLISNGPKEPIKPGYNSWKNWDPSKTAQDVKSYDYDNHTVTYREYRPGQNNTVPDGYTTKTVEKKTVLWSFSTKKKPRIRIENGEMEIPVRINLEDMARNLPEHQKQDLIQSVMDDMDYNDLLDYYGSPELR